MLKCWFAAEGASLALGGDTGSLCEESLVPLLPSLVIDRWAADAARVMPLAATSGFDLDGGTTLIFGANSRTTKN